MPPVLPIRRAGAAASQYCRAWPLELNFDTRKSRHRGEFRRVPRSGFVCTRRHI